MNIIEYMIEEDIGFGDITTDALVPKDLTVKAQIISKESGIIAGVEIIKEIFSLKQIKFESFFNDGDNIKNKDIIFKIEGNAKDILKIERTILNLMMRMSGIATITHNIVKQVRTINSKVKIAGTRKTMPTLAKFDKIAINIGGGDSHRFRLDDLVLIKDNHIAAVGSIIKSIELAKKNVSFSKKIEIEVNSIDDLILATNNGVDIVMLDNMSINEINDGIYRLNDLNLRNKVLIEVSGGINPENIMEYAKTDVDIISLGALTHSVKSLDLSLNINF
ncbi:MAG: carboxylating nicotinate-nucleotide diphosphorylase [Methanobrevibacter sp.]|jgi:nicotinate-nucleotide pyrophosphorylase (carboxylating)|nr:carboxylating nicotinate-nucleotide diphosphorylase [Candidatus Methanoflexus mossambicus]